MNRDYEWWDRNKEALIVPEQAATSIYMNTEGNIVIRQRARWDEDEDTIVVVAPSHAVGVAYAILDAADLPVCIAKRCGGGWVDLERPARPWAEKDDEAEGDGPEEAEPSRPALPKPGQTEKTGDLLDAAGE